MRASSSRVLSQPTVGTASLGLALLLLALDFDLQGQGVLGWLSSPRLVFIGCLLGAVIAAHRFPLHVRHHSKIYVCSIPLYLLAVLSPPPLAMTLVGAGIVGGQLWVRSQRGSVLSDIATDAGRWMVLSLLASEIAHVPLPLSDAALREIPLAAAACLLWGGDLLTCPLTLCPISGEPPVRIIRQVVQEAGLPEAAQHFVGMLGALLVMQQVWALALLALPTLLVYLAFKKELDADTFQLLESMADAVDLRDPSTGGHSKRVADLVKGLLAEMSMTGPEARLITAAARLHDIGKIGIPDQVLHKDGLLTAEERALMETYPAHGAALLSRYPDFRQGADMVLHHHERWDGGGYPAGLVGTEIPFGARVIAIADSFDAMTSTRPYRRGLAPERAASILLQGRGRQWDPVLVDAFLRSINHLLPSQPSALALHLLLEDREPITAAGIA